MPARQNSSQCSRRKTHQHRGHSLREKCKCSAWMRRIWLGNTMLHDLGRGHGLRFCGANTTAETGRRAVPGCLGFNCEEKCQQTEAEGKRSAPIRRGSGEPSRHNGSLSCLCQGESTAGLRPPRPSRFRRVKGLYRVSGRFSTPLWPGHRRKTRALPFAWLSCRQKGQSFKHSPRR